MNQDWNLVMDLVFFYCGSAFELKQERNPGVTSQEGVGVQEVQ